MFELRNFTIRARLYALAAVAILTLLAVGGGGLWALETAGKAFRHFVENDNESIVQLSRVRAGVGNLRRYEKDMLINLADAKAVETYRDEWRETYKKTTEALKAIDALNIPEPERRLVGEILRELQVYQGAFAEVQDGLAKQAYADTAAANKALGLAKAPIRAVEKQLGELTELIDKDAGDGARAVEDNGRKTLWALVAIIVGGVLVIGAYTFFNLGSILQPLHGTVLASARIAQHDLSEAIQVEGRDETADVLNGVKAMQASLRDVVGSVRQATENITTASREVAAGSVDLSNRTEQAASSLEQTASAMEQLTASVRHNADSARQATHLASTASQVAQRGGTVVGDVVGTMDKISASSRKIGDIISVIDGIAFQTNILALNAAVEAARAGEQGRGFAVVAGEVRSLAQRSAEAAKEIKSLINTSTENVESGTALVANAGTTMAEIVSSIDRVSRIVSEISLATDQQSTGIAQVGEAVTQLDQMTQQNAALVEQSAAAAKSLQQQAEELSGSVAVFRL